MRYIKLKVARAVQGILLVLGLSFGFGLGLGLGLQSAAHLVRLGVRLMATLGSGLGQDQGCKTRGQVRVRVRLG